jgi:hypothetical protein
MSTSEPKLRLAWLPGPICLCTVEDLGYRKVDTESEMCRQVERVG